jgi:molybdopterin synthase catalytic subunit
MIRVQQTPFDPGAELAGLKTGGAAGAAGAAGATVMFVGTVREVSDGRPIAAMTLEHYPAMTERALAELEAEARRRWPLDDILIIHRHGKLEPGEDIVLVITRSAHREAAFEACAFLMDWLKTKAPFWKLEADATGERWVETRTSDETAARRWK